MNNRIAIYVLAALMSFSATSFAQESFGTSDAPIFVKAEKATYKGNLTLLHDKVNVQQGEAVIMSDKMEIHRQEKAETETDAAEGSLSLGAVTKIIATGNFRYENPETTVTGNKGIYYRNRGVIVVTDNVKVSQPSGSVVTGDKMVYDLKTDRVKFGDECSGNDCDGGRVSIQIGE